MKVTGWIMTNKVGSKCERTVEIPDEDLEGLGAEEREALIDDYVRDGIFQCIEWGWREDPES